MTRTNTISKTLGVIALFAVLGALLGWGLIAQGWTQLTTTNDARVAIESAKRHLYTARYSLPLGAQWAYPINVTFGRGFCASSGSGSTCSIGSPSSNSSTTIEDYVTFDVSRPNGTAVRIWHTGPTGNLTFECEGTPYPYCNYEPNPPGGGLGLENYYLPVPISGNYSIHVLSEACQYSPNCTTNTAIGTVTIGLSTIQYDRPYSVWGFATELGAIAGIITTIIVAGTIVNREQKRKEALRPRSTSNRPGQVID